jgi:hypothetical protein
MRWLQEEHIQLWSQEGLAALPAIPRTDPFSLSRRGGVRGANGTAGRHERRVFRRAGCRPGLSGGRRCRGGGEFRRDGLGFLLDGRTVTTAERG